MVAFTVLALSLEFPRISSVSVSTVNCVRLDKLVFVLAWVESAFAVRCPMVPYCLAKGREIGLAVITCVQPDFSHVIDHVFVFGEGFHSQGNGGESLVSGCNLDLSRDGFELLE